MLSWRKDVCSHLPAHTLTLRRNHQAGLGEQAFRSCGRGLDRKELASQLGHARTPVLVMAPPSEKAVQAIHCLRVDYRRRVHSFVITWGDCVCGLCARGGCADPDMKTPSISIQLRK